MRDFLWYFLAYSILIGVGSPFSFAADKQGPRLSDLSGDSLSWINLPDELTQRVMPIVAIQLKVGSTKEGSDYLRITPVRRGKTILRLAPRTSVESGYRVEAQEAWYWPEMHLLNLSRDVVVSASNCRLEGGTFDILLNHETTRLVDPKVISLAQGLVPIEADSVRIVGVGGQESPVFHWDKMIPVSSSGEKQETAKNNGKLKAFQDDGKQTVSHMNGKVQPSLSEPKSSETRRNGKQGKNKAPVRPTDLDNQEDSQAGEITIHILDEKKIRFENSPCEIENLEKKIEEALLHNPEGSIVIHQSPGANSNLVRKVQQALTKAKAPRVRTVMERPDTDMKTLQVERMEAVNEDVDNTVPSGPGGRLLWCYGPGKFYLNGKPFDEPSLRQVLRGLVKDSPEIPIVVAGPRDAPAAALKDLAAEVKSYGFLDVQLGSTSTRK